jgi:hypothetical protein
MKSKINYYLKPLRNRLIISITLLLILFGLFNYYSDNYEINNKYLTSKSILSNYPEGKAVYISGDFAGLNDEGFYIKDNFYGQKVIYKINSSLKPLDGDILSITGTLGPSFSINPHAIVINKQWKENFLLVRSAIIGIILLFVFSRYWKFDFKKMLFIRRK